MNQGGYPFAYEQQPERYHSHQALVTVPGGANTLALYPLDQYITCPSNLEDVKADVASAFSEITAELGKITDPSKPWKKVKEGLTQDIQALFDVFVELSSVHHGVAVAIRLLFDSNSPLREQRISPKVYLEKARVDLVKARNELRKISRQFLQRAEQLHQMSNIPHPWLNLVTWFINDKTSSTLTMTTAAGGIAVSAYAYNDAREVYNTINAMSSTNLVTYPVAIAFGFLTLLGAGAANQLAPMLKPYTTKNLEATQKAMYQIVHGPIPRLMDALGSLDLYWKSIARGERVHMNSASTDAWLRLAAKLETNVNECHKIAWEIKEQSPGVKVPPTMKSRTLISSQRNATRHGTMMIDSHYPLPLTSRR